MDYSLLQKLSQNLLEILDDDEYYDITIEVGNDPYVKIFRSHIVILNYRSSYLRRILSTNKKKNDGTLVHIKLPNILPEIFQLILRYIYGGKLSLIDYDNLDIIKILVAANELNLQELIIHIQSFLIQNKANWMEQNFNLIYQTSFENNSFLELQKYCTDLMSKYPDKILKSLDFSSVPEKILISLIQSDTLQMSEIQVWENVLKWGLAQNPSLSSNPSNYSKDDFNSLKNTLQSCIPFIRFYNLTSQEFSDYILPYKEVLPEELYMDLLKTFLSLNPNSKPGHKSNPRMTKEITPPPPPKLSTSTFDDLDKQPQLSSSSSNYSGGLFDLSGLNPNSKPSHKLSPRMAKEITPPPPLRPSYSYFTNTLDDLDKQPQLSSSSSNYSGGLFDLSGLNPNSKPSHKSNPRMTKEITPPSPLSPSNSYSTITSNYSGGLFDLSGLNPNSKPSHKLSPRMSKKIPAIAPFRNKSINSIETTFKNLDIQPRLPSSSSNYSGDLFDSSASTLLSLNPNRNSSPRMTKEITPPRPSTPSYKLPRLSSSSSNYSGGLFGLSGLNPNSKQSHKLSPSRNKSINSIDSLETTFNNLDVQPRLPSSSSNFSGDLIDIELGQEFSEEVLKMLKNMGFNNEEENLKALKECNGELDRVIEYLLKM